MVLGLSCRRLCRQVFFACFDVDGTSTTRIMTKDSKDIRYAGHLALLGSTFLTTSLAGVLWIGLDPFEFSNFSSGLTYAFLILFVISSHEAGHYVAARIHGVDATLPYFIPFPLLPGVLTFGTLGAVIRLKAPITSRKALFDIGSAGPVAGFIGSCIVLVIGFRTLPSIEYLYGVHPDYRNLGELPTSGLRFGGNLLYDLLSKSIVPEETFLPPMNEIYHYPYLCVGWFGMFVTAMNLIPVGQLDGGHITQAMLGSLSNLVGQVSLLLLVVLGTAGFLPMLGVDIGVGWPGWLFWALVLSILLRSKRFRRPSISSNDVLGWPRMAVGWACCLIFVLCFTPTPFSM